MGSILSPGGRREAVTRAARLAVSEERSRRRTGRVGALVLVATALLPLAPSRLLAQEPTPTAESALTGARVFGSRGCAGCHAINGVGANIGPDLGRLEGPPTFFGLAADIWNHLPGMRKRMLERDVRPFRLTPDEVGDLSAFLSTVNAFGRKGDPERGERLFAMDQCIRCHQVDGTGGVVGPNLDFLSQFGSPIVVAAALWNHGPAMMRKMHSLGVTRPTFTGGELLDLIAYLGSRAEAPREGPFYVLPGSAEMGKRLFREKGCIQCHGVTGSGTPAGLDLAARGNGRRLVDFAAAMWNKAPLMIAGMQRRGIEVPSIGPSEMADLVAYLYTAQYFATSGDRARGRGLVRSSGCLACHSLDGAGAGRAADLGRVRGMNSFPAVLAALWSHLTVSGTTEAATHWPSLTARQMADVATYLQSVSSGAR
jgi:mono/diheme cytochrome c family protein